MADKTVMHQDIKQQVVNSHIAKWAHLKPNQHCYLKVTPGGTHVWRNASDQYHRVDENGIQDGPALIYSAGHQSWHINGQRHRLGGPAVTHSNGAKRWFLDHNELTQEEWAKDIRVLLYNSQTQEGAESWLRHL